MSNLREAALTSKAWPFEEARKLLKRIETKGIGDKGYVLFETGYGPSGLPHLGTFGEVARTTMVRHAFTLLSDIPTRLICFSDDMDGLRKVPDNLPNKELLEPHLGKPLTKIPDPFGTHEGFAQHNNARLQAFLDQFGFDYEFYSATECYRSGRFDETLLKLLANYDAVRNVILPTLGEERQATYSPFLPVCPKTGVVLQVPTTKRDVEAGTISYIDPNDGEEMTVPVTGGGVKCQWKADWAMRWVAFGVDYEMAGKDLIDSVKLSSRIAKVLDARPPEGFNYELFLDDKGQKISKSKGNGLTIEEWLRYASPESLSLYMYQAPRKAKRLYFDVIPRAVDEYYQHLKAVGEQDAEKQLMNPTWHIHEGHPPSDVPPISFGLMMNLVGAANASNKDQLWGFISRYVAGATPESEPELDRLAGYAIAYYEDFVAPHKAYRLPNEQERAAMEDLRARLAALDENTDGDTVQTEVFSAGKSAEFENLRDWFKALYECLLGQSQGPRMGGFFALYGLKNSIEMLDKVLSGEKLS